MTTSISSEADLKKIYGKQKVEKESAKEDKIKKPFNNYKILLHLCLL